MNFDAGFPVETGSMIAGYGCEEGEKKRIKAEREKKGKREGRLDSGMEWKDSERIEINEIVLCVRCYIVNGGEDCST